MTWPSRIERTASAIGSLKSSPSTRTVYRPVIEPTSLVPERSRSFGSMANTLGVKPRVAGGSPMARPTSRWAIAKRVTESIISITSAPWSRNASAMVVAASAALMRTSAGWSEVATTTTERASPSGPRSRSMNSRTSRPRSPTRQMTLTSALVDRAIMPSNEDLPTPEPAKMPRRWPRPHGTSASSARTPSDTCSVMRVRCIGSGGEASIGRSSRALRSAPSSGRPNASTTRPSSSTPTGTETGRPVAVTAWPGARPCRAPSGMSSVRPARKPTTSAGTASRERPASTRHTSPTSASRPVTSTIRPMRSLTRPRRRWRSEWEIAWPNPARRSSTGSATELIVKYFSRSVELCLDRRVDLALGGAHDGTAARHAALGLHVPVLDPAQLGGQRPEPSADRLQVLGVDEHLHALPLGHEAQRAADRLEDELGIGGDRGVQRLLGDAQRKADSGVLDTLGHAVALGDDRARGGAQRLLGMGDLRAALGDARLAALGEALGVRGLDGAVDLVGRRHDRHPGARGRRQLVEG